MILFYHKENFNFTTLFIDFCARYGWAYDRRRPMPETIEVTRMKYGYLGNNKPKSVLSDYLLGLVIQTSIIWSTLVIRFLIKIIY